MNSHKMIVSLFHWPVLFDMHGTLMVIGALLLPDHRSGIFCNNLTLLSNSNGV